MITNIFYYLNSLFFNFCIAFYLISAMQWYSYKIKRIIFHYHKPMLHIYFLAIPYFIFLSFPLYSLIYFAFLHTAILYAWNKSIDQKLVFTTKVKWFFVFVFLFNTLFALLAFEFSFLFNLLTLPSALISLKIYEFITAKYYLYKAKSKINKNAKLTIVLVTGSFGKTSMKNFLYALLKDTMKTYKTPKSVNTLMGIIRDVNENLNDEIQIYIAEAGARTKGDILEITKLLQPQICIIGEIGNAHLQYFKNTENTRQTKLEALLSKKLQRAFLHSSTQKDENEVITLYDTKLVSVDSTLENLRFQVLLQKGKYEFSSELLGSFNAENLCACILCAEFLGVEIEHMQKQIQTLKAIKHRLQVIAKEPKFIIDDGYNGNLKGMSQSYMLCKQYAGRKVLVTPGIIEVDEEENKKLCASINECFDFAIISAQINTEIFQKELTIPSIFLKEKSELVQILAKHTQKGDLILFSNDAPSYL
ncbi:UDP-N-acetylmuramoyl-tripeptide--D-alanyl-D-alanine ligase [Campylobacter sp. MIT 21-1685]|uniref:Mur ligase family protein n=1 Tax=unclassified Campylobacter TaxID=2593542 RepID=UPI00224B407F|nr:MULTISPECIES: UDP-N-acetylmuramoyl-tripeptide--D-alanyl-D-alanine ligase [unclassified Campylobacter]MCX2683602.1 UDP-N-acetylmuramoyl-tripeptide--D-alanyl-D-alanine ligase [Campylobacter sp. MIT 21-1684]MCX2751885.1 UDP-N-acetylmuramoyl-tripeptide--D-alanyl-D-alanine ligase [Campylobacter sp. MIT 21-1682]MCX2808062.1 UDP-N-acetylmuramoyl-tripeptide--D-alanyl-D-alanine ligase [Campylobacter sp. MIT 21-1685]